SSRSYASCSAARSSRSSPVPSGAHRRSSGRGSPRVNGTTTARRVRTDRNAETGDALPAFHAPGQGDTARTRARAGTPAGTRYGPSRARGTLRPRGCVGRRTFLRRGTQGRAPGAGRHRGAPEHLRGAIPVRSDRARPHVVLAVAPPGRPGTRGRPGDERRGDGREPPTRRVGRPRPEPRAASPVPRRFIRRSRVRGERAVPGATARGVRRRAPCPRSRWAGRRVVLQPVLPDEGRGALALGRRRRSPAGGAHVS